MMKMTVINSIHVASDDKNNVMGEREPQYHDAFHGPSCSRTMAARAGCSFSRVPRTKPAAKTHCNPHPRCPATHRAALVMSLDLMISSIDAATQFVSTDKPSLTPTQFKCGQKRKGKKRKTFCLRSLVRPHSPKNMAPSSFAKPMCQNVCTNLENEAIFKKNE
jgi:hypothetical protein